jgi:hypothetical protein
MGKMADARRPDRFTQDFLETKLGQSGGGSRPIVPLLKRMGFIGGDGTPTARYDQFRNEQTRKGAVAAGIRQAFSELFDRNEYVYELPREKLTSLVIEITGATKDDRVTQAIVSTFLALREIASFDESVEEVATPKVVSDAPLIQNLPELRSPVVDTRGNVDFRVAYTINLNLPETTNPEVFTAIFKALRENLLRDQ